MNTNELSSQLKNDMNHCSDPKTLKIQPDPRKQLQNESLLCQINTQQCGFKLFPIGNELPGAYYAPSPFLPESMAQQWVKTIPEEIKPKIACRLSSKSVSISISFPEKSVLDKLILLQVEVLSLQLMVKNKGTLSHRALILFCKSALLFSQIVIKNQKTKKLKIPKLKQPKPKKKKKKIITNVSDQEPFQCSVNIYDSLECDLQFHRDSVGSQVLIVSLGSSISLNFVKREDYIKGPDRCQVKPVFLEENSLLFLTAPLFVTFCMELRRRLKTKLSGLLIHLWFQRKDLLKEKKIE